MSLLDARSSGLTSVGARLEGALDQFLRGQEGGPYGELLAPALRVLRQFLEGGKRVRPLYCHAGWQAAGGGEPTREFMDMSVGLELFHALALLHDDVIDRSDVRRARPAAHRLFIDGRPGGCDEWFGMSAAILLGDLCQSWSAELMHGPPEPQISRSAGMLAGRMRTEMLVGQLMDISPPPDALGTVGHAFQVIHYKTTLYTVKRPLQIGAAMAGAGQEVLDACAHYAEPLGEAFQLLDDLEDVEPPPGSAHNTGNDLREGKRTVLLALAAQKATTNQRNRLGGLVGRDDLSDEELAEARQTIIDTGATAAVRKMILDRRKRALDSLTQAPFHPAGTKTLRELTDRALPGVAEWHSL